MSADPQEQTLLETVVADLEAEGFEVFIHPSDQGLPMFLRGQSPDVIARRSNENLVVEIVRAGSSSERKLAKLRESISSHGDWKLKVYFVSPSSTPRVIERQSPEIVQGQIKMVEDLVSEGRLGPALLMGWATFEAQGRALLPDQFARPQTPGRLVEVLASNGHITPSEADRLRHLAETRNRLIHGSLQTEIAESDMKAFVEMLNTLLGLMSARPAPN